MVVAWAPLRALLLSLAMTLPVVSCRSRENSGNTDGRASEVLALRDSGSATDSNKNSDRPIPVASTAIAEAIRAQLMGAQPDAIGDAAWQRVRALYDSRANAPAWAVGGTFRARARALVSALRTLPDHGMRIDDYPLEALTTALASAGPNMKGDDWTAQSLARAELLLTATTAMYVADMLAGQVDPRELEPSWHIPRQDPHVGQALARVLSAKQFDDALASVVPRDADYATLRRALVRYRDIASNGGWPLVPSGPTLRPGDSTADAPVLRRRLAASDLLRDTSSRVAIAPDTAAQRETRRQRYDGELAEAVARFQQRHGLTPDSVVGPRTRSALNVTAADRATQIMANLERYRWLPTELGGRHIVVNIPAFRLDAFDGDRTVLSMRVVVGDELSNRRTPVFSDSMSYVQFGPYWNVPRSIATNEILPKVRRDRGYLAANNYEVVRGWGEDAPVVNINTLSNRELSSSRYRIRQQPGPDNALGRVKFIFPNDFNIYLHDTPAQALFDEQRRAYSHGCVRVAEPEALAEYVLARQPEWTSARIRSAIGAGQHTRVDLAEKLPVYLVYLTAFANGGEVAFRDDLYDRDDALQRHFRSVLDGQGLERQLNRLVTLLQ